MDFRRSLMRVRTALCAVNGSRFARLSAEWTAEIRVEVDRN